MIKSIQRKYSIIYVVTLIIISLISMIIDNINDEDLQQIKMMRIQETEDGNDL